MSKLHSCAECSSFVPTTVLSCPNCGSEVSKKTRSVVGPLVVAGGVVLAMTLSACYGGPVNDYEDSGPRDSGPDLTNVDAGNDSGTAP